jgi:hypothetical protein
MITDPVNISIEDNKILMSLPFSKNFIKDLRSEDIFSLNWDYPNSRYEAVFSTDSLKKIIQVVSEHFSTILYCPVATKVLATINEYTTIKYWQPTLVCKNNFYYIAASNENLQNAIRDIPLNSDVKTISLLAEYGIAVDQELIKSDNRLLFASQFFTRVDYDSTENIVQRLKDIECDCAIFANRHYTAVGNTLYTDLIKEGFHVTIIHDKLNLDLEYKKVKRPVMIKFLVNYLPLDYSLNIKKVIKITNSLPVYVK